MRKLSTIHVYEYSSALIVIAIKDIENKFTLIDKVKSVDRSSWSVDDASLIEATLLGLKSEIENSMTPTLTP